MTAVASPQHRAHRCAIAAFTLGALGVLVDALITYSLLRVPGHHENHGPVRAVLDLFGLELGLILVSVTAVAVFAVLALAAVRARRPLANGAGLVLVLAVAARLAVIAWNLQVS